MTVPQLHAEPLPEGTALTLRDGTRVIPPDAWALSGHPASALAQHLLLNDEATEAEDRLLAQHAAMARLGAAEAGRLGLPPSSSLHAVVEGEGLMMRPGFTVTLRWTRPGGQNVLGVQRIGAWLREPEGWRRLPETLFRLAGAVQAYQSVPGEDEPARLAALAALREALPQAALSGLAEGSGLLGSVTILEADAVSLDAVGEGNALQVVPVLHRAGRGTEPLLPADRQRQFGHDQFLRWPAVRGVYSLAGGTYVVLAPPLRAALDVVRRIAAAPVAQRREFLREPRAAIQAALGEGVDAAMLDALVLETPHWSERVLGLGLWRPRVLPWVVVAGQDWFGGAAGEAAAPKGLLVGDQPLELGPQAAADLADRVREAMAAGEPTVTVLGAAGEVQVPASAATLEALRALPKPRISTEADPVVERAPAQALLIKPNETDQDIEALIRRRPGPLSPTLPKALLTSPKEHQSEGIRWLQQHWLSGSPGVLLADDMGLGKTLQGLAFLAWLRESMRDGSMPRDPLLIVAPTGLLENWRAEHGRHLRPPGLGEPLLAYGKGLAALRRSEDGRLDTAAIAAADWVLTTYETLRDHDRDFGSVRFAAMLMDEAQKVKTPGIRLTDAAKAMHADFRVALTGTPVENRLADLWCIVDGVAPGHLSDLRRFSATYEAGPTLSRLAELKALLDQPRDRRPALMLRRLKEDRLPDLPTARMIVHRAPMEGAQLAAYRDAVALARSDQGAGRVLEALQRLRAVSLHPDVAGATEDAALIAGSARLRLALSVLDDVASRDEGALIFVEDLTLMAQLAGLLQRRYHLAAPPMCINGQVSGAARQARVDRFQEGGLGFDAMLLSPRAGGVGLTLTRANHVIHLSRWWNPAVEDQCNGRALRIGQERAVHVHLPLAVLSDGMPSFDERLHALLDRKRHLMREVLLPPESPPGELADLLGTTLGD